MADPTSSDRQISFLSELWRKGVHLVSLSIPAFYALSGFTKWQMLTFTVPVFLLMILLDMVRLNKLWLWTEFGQKFLGGMVRRHERLGDFTGATYILLSVCAVVFLYNKWIAIAAMSLIIVGDVFAALIGRSLGKIRFGRKTVEGSLGCLLGTLLVAFLTPNLPLIVTIPGAVVATIVEAFSLRIDDNVSVPLLSGLAMTIFYKIFVSG